MNNAADQTTKQIANLVRAIDVERKWEKHLTAKGRPDLAKWHTSIIRRHEAKLALLMQANGRVR